METKVENSTGERTASTTDGVAEQGACVEKQQLEQEVQERLADRITNLAERVRVRKLLLDKVAIEVLRIDRIFETMALPLLPGTGLLNSIDGLADALYVTGNLSLAEVMAMRALKADCSQTGELQWNEWRVMKVGDILARMGRLTDAKECFRFAAILAQERLRPEHLVFELLYHWAETAMEQEDFAAAAVAYDRAVQMESVDRDAYDEIRGIKHSLYQEILFKMKLLPLEKRVKTPFEVEYDRVAAARRREAQTKKGQVEHARE